MPKNILLITTDDQPAWTIMWQPKLRALLRDEGLTFDNACVADPLCAPNRASILLGKYPHSHGITGNEGSTEEFRRKGYEDEHYGAVLGRAGYRTGYFGKFLNRHPTNPEWLMGGFERSVQLVGEQGDDERFWINDNGDVQTVRRAEWDDTDYLAHRAGLFLNSDDPRPFLCVLSLWAPHFPFDGQHIPERHRGSYEGIRAPEGPIYEDPPEGVAPDDYTEAQRDRHFRGMREELGAVDDAVEKMIDRLRARGHLQDTYVFFTTDNGFMLGEHKQFKKSNHYEEAVRVPMLVRGPGVAQGLRPRALVSSVDLAPTFCDIADTTMPRTEGVSLRPLFDGTEPDTWRDEMLIEHNEEGTRGWAMLRTKRYSYVEFDSGERLLYDRAEDPDMLRPVHEPETEADLSARLSARTGS